MSRRKVISMETHSIPCKGEGHLCETFVVIRIGDANGLHEEFIVLTEANFLAIMEIVTNVAKN
jgi:hypothetical protein